MELSDYIIESRKLAKNSSMRDVRIAFLSNFTINGIAETMKFLCFKYKVYAESYISQYNQYAQDILNKSSGLYHFKPDIIFILLDIENFFGDYYYFYYRMDNQQRGDFIQKKFDEIRELIKFLKKNTNAKIIVNTLLIPNYSSRGILENKQDLGIRGGIYNLNNMLESLSVDSPQLFVFDMNSFCSKVGYEFMRDKKMDYLGDMKISPSALVKISFEYMGYIIPLMSMTKKCIVLDLDNTLWGGIVGEEGIENIKLGPEKEGKPFLDFQKRLLELFEKGIILAVNSKNNYEDAIEVIKSHKYMILKEHHFASMKINWRDKVTNMKEIAEDLNIGVDSLVYIDDDKTNRELMKNILPEVFVLDLPEDPCLYPSAIESLTIFNLFNITDEDLNRGKMYADQNRREQFRAETTDIESFLKQLEIKVDIIQANKMTIPRVAQLTQKTNQFNLTTRRYQEEDIRSLLESGKHIIKCINVRDRFGDYGLTGVVIITKCDNGGYWDIDTFLLSCRILGKNIEFSLMQNIIDDARRAGIKKIFGRFISTKKNKPAECFLEECGFLLDKEENEEKCYTLNIGEEKKNNSYAEVIEWKL